MRGTENQIARTATAAAGRGSRNAVRTLLALGLLALASLLAASPASAIYDHSVLETQFKIGCSPLIESHIADIAVDEGEEFVYVFCETGQGEPDKIYRYDYDGTPAPFQATKSYISGNELTGNPGAANGNLNSGFSGPHIAVDNSGGPHDGEIYLVTAASGLSGGTENISIFKKSGEYAGFIEEPEFLGGNSNDVDVGPDGSVYFLSSSRVSKYNSGYNEVARMYTSGAATFTEGNRIVADNKGAIWIVQNGPQKYEPDQLFTNFPKAFGTDVELFTGTPSPFVPIPVTSGFANGSHIAIDPSVARNDIYVNRGNKIEVFSEGNAADPAYMNAPTFGAGIVGDAGITVTKDGHVFSSTPTACCPSGEAGILRFGPGNILPDVHTDPADVEKIGHEGAELTGAVDLDGGTAVVNCEVQVGLSKGSYGVASAPCTPSSFGTNSPISAEPSGLNAGTLYHYRFAVTNEKGTNYGGDREFRPAYVLKVKTLPATSIDENGATLNGQLDPDGKAAEYYFEYGVDTSYGQETAPVSAGSGSGLVHVGQAIASLPAGRRFHYRIVTSNENGTTRGEDRTLVTASVPEVSGLRTTNLTETSATLHATINPNGYPTHYHFEYGPSSAYGQVIPVPDEDLGSGTEPIDVEETITGLTPGVTYHFRAVATNEPWGTAYSTDTTFDFAPPTCPNDHARQETASTFLPDCRGYELVSPGAAGAVSLYPGKEVWDLSSLTSQDPLSQSASWVLNYGRSTSPPRLMFYGILGTIEGLAAPNLLTPDAYLASRTASGWVTTLPGLDDSHGIPSLKQCADDFHMCLEFNTPIENETFESEAWVHTAEGKFVTKLPTNANLVPGANEYKGFRRVSSDFTNFAFSSNTTKGIFGTPYDGVAFTVDGQTTGAGSAYDNDLEERTVMLISRLPGTLGGGHIPQNGKSTRPIQFPGISADGSHILMLTEGGFGEGKAGPPYRLYMRVNDAVSYDVSKGNAIEFVGMSRDGSSVTFTSAEQLTGADTDNSVDLYRWSEDTDSLTLLSVGNGKGNSDECAASWTEGCGVEVPNTERRWAMESEIPFGNQGVPYFDAQGLDDVTAENSGDVYFYSPEQLDGSKLGIENSRNLYVVRPNGDVQLVASLDVGTQVNRMNISTDGKFAALLTESRLTPYDNKGLREVYVYDAEERTLVCGSCRPGAPPTKDVAVSQGGKFMADDGRAFFATEDSLVPRDKNGDIYDVYEYVGGRPQLISSGLAARDFTGESTIFGLFAKPEYTGLEAVSRDGLDVYFSTFSTLVDEDHNGQFIKFYDARTNGGFSQPPVDAPCAAADECHGTDSSAPTPPTVTSGVNLGDTGNVQQTKKKAKKKKHAKHRRRKERKRRNARNKRRHHQKQLRHSRRRSNG